MGGDARWDASSWKTYTDTHVAGKSTDRIFTSRRMKPAYDPKEITVRESRDSDINPSSTPFILGLDVTGSMGRLADVLMRDGLNTTVSELIKRAPAPDPHVMVMAIGDAETDEAPAQATQFEGSIKIAEQTAELWLEGGGGPNGGESYMAPHLFAAMKTATDAWDKRRKKGFLITIGDEPTLDGVTKAQAKKFLGIDLQSDLSAAECIAMAQERYEVLHIIVAEGRGGMYGGVDHLLGQWNRLLPQRVLVLKDHTKLAETIVSAVQVIEGASKAAVADSWDRSTALVVADAVSALAERGTGRGIRRL